jgi:hypothetical protein
VLIFATLVLTINRTAPESLRSECCCSTAISAPQTSIPTRSVPRIVIEVSAVGFDIAWQQKYLSVDRALLDYVGTRRPWTRSKLHSWD